MADHDHDWVFVVTLAVTRREVERALAGQRLVFRKVDPQTSRSADLACMKCEMTAEAAINVPCPGEPSGYGADGTPFWGAGPLCPVCGLGAYVEKSDGGTETWSCGHAVGK